MSWLIIPLSTPSNVGIKKKETLLPKICKKYQITNYTINEDGSVDVNGDVYLQDYYIKELPLTFNKVTGIFDCDGNNLTSLEGSPQSVGGYFYCHNNNLTSLKGSPIEVSDQFDCSQNKLTSLEGSPESVGGGFYCEYNKLTSLEGSPNRIDFDFDCGYNNLTSLEGSPESVGGNFYCFNNNLTSLEGSPKSIGGNFYCRNNPIVSIFDKVDMDFIRAFKTFKVIKDGVIDLKRLRYVMSMFDLPIDIEKIEKYYTIKWV